VKLYTSGTKSIWTSSTKRKSEVITSKTWTISKSLAFMIIWMP